MDELHVMLSTTFFENVDPRRRQERSDSRMVQEDHSKTANLSDKAVYHTFDPWRKVERLKSY